MTVKNVAQAPSTRTVQSFDNHFELILLASRRCRDLLQGAEPRVPRRREKMTVIALTELKNGLVTRDEAMDSLIVSLQSQARDPNSVVGSVTSRSTDFNDRLPSNRNPSDGGHELSIDQRGAPDTSGWSEHLREHQRSGGMGAGKSRSKDDLFGEIDPRHREELERGLTDNVDPSED